MQTAGEIAAQLQAANAGLHTQVEVARQLGARDAEAIAALRAERDAVRAAAAAEIQQARHDAERRADAAWIGVRVHESVDMGWRTDNALSEIALSATVTIR